MRKELNLFVDPISKKHLDIKVEKEKFGHIIYGKLYNSTSVYPIHNGIPRFVPESFYKAPLCNSKEIQTAESFGNKWNEKRHGVLGRKNWDTENLTEQFMALLGCQSFSQLKDILGNAQYILNAGCGTAWSEYLFNINSETQRHCIDISLAVEMAYKKTKNFKNVIVSQASIFELPYKDETFDIIYSLGVIHHTPDPEKALKALVKKLKPDGLIGIYIYNKKPLIREIVDKEIREITTKMSYKECMDFSKKMTRLGKALNEIGTHITIKDNIHLLGIKKGKYSVHNFIYDYFLKCWYNPKQDTEYADLVNQDWYHPHYASHHTKEEVIDWFINADIKDLKCIQPKGWEYSGYFISGRKKPKRG